MVVVAALLALVAYDLLQRRQAILRTFPVIGHLRFLLESFGPELRQYIVTSNDEERPFTRDQRVTIINGMLVFVLMVVIMQLWLLTATMNAWLGGDEEIVWPAALVSTAGLALNIGLLVYLRRMEHTRKEDT